MKRDTAHAPSLVSAARTRTEIKRNDQVVPVGAGSASPLQKSARFGGGIAVLY